MRVGLFPGQAAAIRAAYAEQRRRLSRRGLFLALGSSVVAGACGSAAGRGGSAPVVDTAPSKNALHAVALGPIDELRRQAMHIEVALESSPDDPVLGVAFQRLVTVVLTRPEDEALARRLQRLGERADMPTHFADGARLLRDARKR